MTVISASQNCHRQPCAVSDDIGVAVYAEYHECVRHQPVGAGRPPISRLVLSTRIFFYVFDGHPDLRLVYLSFYQMSEGSVGVADCWRLEMMGLRAETAGA